MDQQADTYPQNAIVQNAELAGGWVLNKFQHPAFRLMWLCRWRFAGFEVPHIAYNVPTFVRKVVINSMTIAQLWSAL